jgi:hypothetical protein
MPTAAATSTALATMRWMLVLLNYELGLKLPLPTNVSTLDGRTREMIAHFQLQQGLAVSGKLSPQTCQLLRQRAAERAAARVLPGHKLPLLMGMTEDDKFWFYARCLASTGDDGRDVWRELRTGKKILLGLRVPTNTRSRNGAGAYDDRIVVMWYDEHGRCHEFEANTDPSSRYEDKYEHADQKKATTNDADGDGVGDLGRLPYGVYRFHREANKDYGDILRPSQNITVERDTGHNGWFSSKDKVTNKKALNSGRSILFHRGGTQITGSAGCQTMRPYIFTSFIKALGEQHEFLYVLMPASDVWSRPLPQIDLPLPDLDAARLA